MHTLVFMKFTRLMTVISVVMLLLVCGGTAQIEDDDWGTATETSVIRRKRPRFFRRPARETAAEQLAYAQTLEADGRLRAARRAYNALVHTWHDTREAAKAQMAYARLLKEAGRYNRAFDQFQYMIEHYPGEYGFVETLEYQFTLAEKIMNRRYMSWLFLPGYNAPERALPLLETITGNAPRWERTDEAYFMIGRIHENRKRYADAIAAYDVVQRRFPRGPFALEASFRRVDNLRRLALKYPRDEQLVRNALSACAGFLAGPGRQSEYRATVQGYLDELKAMLAGMHYERAVYYDRIARRPDSALLAYRDYIKRFPDGGDAANVRERIDELDAKVELPGDE